MTPSPSFPSHIPMNKPMSTPFNTSVTSPPMNLNSNNFLSDLDPISNNKNRVPMNQMMSNARPTFPAAPVNHFQNSANNSLAALNPMIPNQSNSGNRNGQDSTISLSAQEINDFLS